MHINLHYKDRPDKTSVDLRLYHFGYESCEPNHSWGPGIKDHYKIHVVFEGQGEYTTPYGTYTLTAGDIFLTVPDCVVQYKASEENPWTYGWFAFNGMNAPMYLDRAGLHIEKPILHLKRLELVCDIILNMTQVEMAESTRDLVLLSHLYRLLSEVIDSASSPLRRSQAVGANLYIEEALNYIETNYSRQMRIEEMACHIGIQRKYLARLFNQHFATSPQQYLVTYRMEKAKQLIEKTELSISEVATSVGYPDPFAFSKRFKSCFGMAPTDYRQKRMSDI